MTEPDISKLAGVADVFGADLIPVEGTGEVCTDEGCGPSGDTGVPELVQVDDRPLGEARRSPSPSTRPTTGLRSGRNEGQESALRPRGQEWGRSCPSFRPGRVRGGLVTLRSGPTTTRARAVPSIRTAAATPAAR